jgi:small subunit ribosomal protein S18
MKIEQSDKKINIKHIDWRDVELLRRFLDPNGRIVSRRRSRLTSATERKLKNSVKRARFMGLLPYIER